MYAFLAEALVGLHLCVVLFMLLGFLGVCLGWPLGWSWIKNPWFRWSHLGIMLYIVLSALNNALCFLTHWEAALRARAGQADSSEGSFIGRLLHDAIYIDVPLIWLQRSYYLIGVLFVLQWIFVRPRPFRRRSAKSKTS